MALATQCPHCHTTFRVASDQLKLRGGIVRCGSCQRIFDGNAHLIDLEALAAARKAAEAAPAAEAPAAEAAPVDTPALAEPAAPAPEPAQPPAAPEPADDPDNAPVYTLDFDHTFDPFGILPKVEPTLDAVPDDLPPAPDAGTDIEAETETEAAVDMPPASSLERIEPMIEPIADPGDEARAEPGFGPPPDQAVATPASEPFAPESSEPESEPELEPESEPAHAPAPAHAYAPAGRIEPSFALPVDEELVAQPLPGHEPEPEPEHPADTAQAADTDTEAVADAETVADADAEAAASRPAPLGRSLQADIPSAALPLRASADADAPAHPAHGAPPPRSARAKAVEARARRSKMTPTRIEAPKLRVPAEADEPEFVKRSRRQEQSGRTMRILMAAGAVLLLLLLAAQLLLNFRSELAVRYPAARPLLSGLCFVAGCKVGLPAQAENLVIDDGELATLGPDTYSLSTQLRNQGSLVQAWPSIELELTDANNKPLLRRVFGPADYLPAGTAIAAGFGARAEQPVRLNFALTGLKPSGYHTFVFYP